MIQANGLKFLAAVIAVILWAYVRVTVGGVSQTSTTQLELRIPLETKVGGSNLIPYEKSIDTITVTVRGDSQVVDELRAGLVSAYVDLEKMAAGSNWPEVQVLVPAGVSIIKVEPSSVNVHLSPLMIKEVPIKIETAGSPKQGFKVGTPIYEPPSVKLEGPEELVSQVSMASGVVPVEGLSETLALRVNNLVPLNENGTAVMGADTSLRLAVREVRVTIPIEESETRETLDVDISNVDFRREPGYKYKLDYTPKFVRVNTSLLEEQLPDSLKVASITLRPNGLNVEEVEVKLEVPEGITVVGPATVKLILTPSKDSSSKDKQSDASSKND